MERCVQTVKAMLKKIKFSGENFHLALLAYRANPHETTMVSPAHLLMGRRLRTTFPVLPSHLEPEVVSRNIVHPTDQEQKAKQATFIIIAMDHAHFRYYRKVITY